MRLCVGAVATPALQEPGVGSPKGGQKVGAAEALRPMGGSFIKRQAKVHADEDEDKGDPPHCRWSGVKGAAVRGDRVQFLLTLDTELPRGPAIPLLGLRPQK